MIHVGKRLRHGSGRCVVPSDARPIFHLVQSLRLRAFSTKLDGRIVECTAATARQYMPSLPADLRTALRSTLTAVSAFRLSGFAFGRLRSELVCRVFRSLQTKILLLLQCCSSGCYRLSRRLRLQTHLLRLHQHHQMRQTTRKHGCRCFPGQSC